MFVKADNAATSDLALRAPMGDGDYVLFGSHLSVTRFLEISSNLATKLLEIKGRKCDFERVPVLLSGFSECVRYAQRERLLVVMMIGIVVIKLVHRRKLIRITNGL
ncbi:hypothetical protein EVAR_228_1 [Eumeta japonica]|uniref:Uncharacterized protein n=1 Tax=Eumeta variegata TaxID=151549 RepID=A0A4C1SBG7_EUMVA|nr:hypothetical protein EVAR_228_1 [Eumeta japonica]